MNHLQTIQNANLMNLPQSETAKKALAYINEWVVAKKQQIEAIERGNFRLAEVHEKHAEFSRMQTEALLKQAENETLL